MTGYYQRLGRACLEPLWESLAALAPAEPTARARPYLWAYDQVREHLLEAGRLITAEEAERRVVVLANPGLHGKLQVTDTLYAGLQLILPGEIAPAHRHSQSALRFVMEGQGAYTAVDGERAYMKPGDFIITPAMTWHEHGGGDQPVIWLDGLDVPLVGFLGAGFREELGDTALAPLQREDSPAFAWPYDRTREALEGLKAGRIDAWRGHVLRYQNPAGGWAMPTLGPTLTLLPKGFATRPRKSIDSAVATLVEGRVRATVGGESFELGPRDLLALPGWTEVRLEALEESVLFAFSDRPVHEALGLWREERVA
ncbi:MAG TPA: cupin domain-containing protein [Caulobacteraceae bacterium]